jgi:TetR/AcrR family transcriptional repressor of nem operon
MTKGEITRRNIVAQAAAVFNQKGYEGSSVSELCALTRLQKGGLYRHFASKEELALEAFDYAVRKAVEARSPTEEERARLSPFALLQLSVQRFAEPEGELVPGGCPLLNTAVDADDGNPALRARVECAMASWLEKLTMLAREAVEVGELAEDIEPDAVSLQIVATLEGALIIARLQRSRDPVLRMTAQLQSWLVSLKRNTGGS